METKKNQLHLWHDLQILFFTVNFLIMKNIKIVGIFFLFFFAISCEKEDEVINHPVPDNYNIQGTITIDAKQVSLDVWDWDAVDGDVIDIIVNGTLLANDLEVTGFRKSFNLSLDVGTNYIGIEVEDAGTSGSQMYATPRIEITDDTQTQSFNIEAGFGIPGAYVLKVEI